MLREDGERARRRGRRAAGRRRARAAVAREFKRRLGDPTPILLGGTPYARRGADGPPAALRRRRRSPSARASAPDAVARHPPGQLGPVQARPARARRRGSPSLGRAVAFAHRARGGRHLTTPATRAGRARRASSPSTTSAAAPSTPPCCARPTTGFELLGEPEGIERLGGIDFDEAVLRPRRRAARRRRSSGSTATTRPAAPALARLRDECAAAKEALSTDTDASIPVLLPGVQTEVRLTRAEFEAMIRPRARRDRRRAASGPCASAGRRRSTDVEPGPARRRLVAHPAGRQQLRAGDRPARRRRRPPQVRRRPRRRPRAAARRRGRRPARRRARRPPSRRRRPSRRSSGAPSAAAAGAGPAVPPPPAPADARADAPRAGARPTPRLARRGPRSLIGAGVAVAAIVAAVLALGGGDDGGGDGDGEGSWPRPDQAIKRPPRSTPAGVADDHARVAHNGEARTTAIESAAGALPGQKRGSPARASPRSGVDGDEIHAFYETNRFEPVKLDPHPSGELGREQPPHALLLRRHRGTGRGRRVAVVDTGPSGASGRRPARSGAGRRTTATPGSSSATSPRGQRRCACSSPTTPTPSSSAPGTAPPSPERATAQELRTNRNRD